MIDILIIAHKENTFDGKGLSENVSVHFVPRIGEYVEFGFKSGDYEVTEVNHYFGLDSPSIELIVKEIS